MMISLFSKTKYYKQCRHNSNLIRILCNNAAKIQTIFHSSKHFSDYLQFNHANTTLPYGITSCNTAHCRKLNRGAGDSPAVVHFSFFPTIPYISITTLLFNNLIPLLRNFGVLILISQSTTKTVPFSEHKTFSSCISLK